MSWSNALLLLAETFAQRAASAAPHARPLEHMSAHGATPPMQLVCNRARRSAVDCAVAWRCTLQAARGCGE